ncbi:MAG: hypothetical protein Q8O02_02335, partial [Candidatus Omnitrophota bacterium]|nr:hypothetical protein [Candidatus Omnitrophota bacterium]
GENADKVAGLFGNDKNIISAVKLDDVLNELDKRAVQKRGKGEDIVVLKPAGEKIDLGSRWEDIRQIGFAEAGISIVDMAKALEVLTGRAGDTFGLYTTILSEEEEKDKELYEPKPPIRKALRVFYFELKSEQAGVILETTYGSTKAAIFTELKTGSLELPPIEFTQKVSENISNDLETVLKFTEKYL